MKDYCCIIRERKKEIEELDFRINGEYYSAKIIYPGTSPLISMKKQGNCENIMFIVQNDGIKEGNPNNPDSTYLKNQLETILNGKV